MAILIDETRTVLVQGSTSPAPGLRSRLPCDGGGGTRVVAGCTPGKGGQDVLGVPVFDSVAEAVETVGQIDISTIFVPAPLVKDAALEALYAGIPLAGS